MACDSVIFATGWPVWVRNAVKSTFFAPRPDRPSLLYSWNRVSLSGLKRPGRVLDHSPTPSAEVKKRVGLCLYSPPRLSWTVLVELYTPHLLLAHPYSFLPVRAQTNLGRDKPVGIATRYGLEGPGIESRCRRNFPHLSRPALWLTQLPVQWVPGLSWWYSGRGVALTSHIHLAPRLKKG
jgi:hypothetical protein